MVKILIFSLCINWIYGQNVDDAIRDLYMKIDSLEQENMEIHRELDFLENEVTGRARLVTVRSSDSELIHIILCELILKDMKNQISNLEYENQNLQMTVDQLEMQNSQQDMTLSNLEMSNQQLENESSQLQRDVSDLNVSNVESKKA